MNGQNPPESQQQGYAQPQQNPPPQQPGQYAPYVKPYPPQPKSSIFEVLVKNSALSAIIALALILMLIGVIMVDTSSLTTNYGSNPPNSQEKIADDKAFGNALRVYGNLLVDIGILLISTFILLAGILRKEMDKFARAGLVIAAALIMGFWIYQFLARLALISTISSW